MTEEEKKAIEDLKDILKYWQTIVEIEDDVEREIEMNCYSEEMPFEQLKIALNLIEKLQKENEELKKQKVEYLDKIYNKIDNLKYEYKKAAMHSDPERASFYRDLIRHFKILLEEE